MDKKNEHNEKEQSPFETAKISKKPSFENVVYSDGQTRISSYFPDGNVNIKQSPCSNIFHPIQDVIKSLEPSEAKLFFFETLIMKKVAEFKQEEVSIQGQLLLTSYRVTFNYDRMLIRLHDEFFSAPLSMVTKVEKGKFIDKKYSIDLFTKDNKCLKFIVSDDDGSLGDYFISYLSQRTTSTFFTMAKELYLARKCELKDSNWKFYNIVEECERMGIDLKSNSSKLRLCQLNNDFSICESYPQSFVVPRFFTDEDVLQSRGFRTKNRLPVFCWMNCKNKASLWRSSQTKSGITHQRSNKDEFLLKLIGDYSEGLVIYDARPYLNAWANKLKGAGFENTEHYKNTAIQFCEIENIHAVRTALMKVYSICKSQKLYNYFKSREVKKKFYTNFEQSLWGEYILLLLRTASNIALSLEKNSSVLVHCSDGWDRTTQLVSLTQLMLDKYYRTLEGFIVLIEKEWIAFGHQFGLRSGFITKEGEDQISPIFLQFLDAIHQLIIKYPGEFEFNMNLLLFLAYHHQNSYYGTFLFNNEKDRKSNSSSMTISIWNDVITNRQIFTNPFYDNKKLKDTLINYSFNRVRFWEEYFFQNNLEYASRWENLSYHNEFDFKTEFNFYEDEKRRDLQIIDSNKKELDVLKQVFKELHQLSFVFDIKSNLSPGSRQLLEKVVNEDEGLFKLPEICNDYFKVEESKKK